MKQTVRSLAAKAGVRTAECIAHLNRHGIGVRVGGHGLAGAELARAGGALGLLRPATDGGPERLVRTLRPLREKGKLGPTHTTALEHLYGHGIPDHQKAEARRLVEHLVGAGALGEKVSRGRRHVWLTAAGLKELGRAVEDAIAGAVAPLSTGSASGCRGGRTPRPPSSSAMYGALRSSWAITAGETHPSPSQNRRHQTLRSPASAAAAAAAARRGQHRAS